MSKVYLDAGGVELRYLRIGGPGVGNILWLWVQALHVYHTTGLDIVWPIWNQIKPKALLRREYSMGIYWSLFSKPNREYYTTAPVISKKKLRIPRVLLLNDNVDRLKLFVEENKAKFDFVIDNLEDPFSIDCTSFSSLVKSDWRSMTYRYKEKLDDRKNSLSVHIRRGDFVSISYAIELSIYENEINRYLSSCKIDRIEIYTDAVESDIEFWKWVKSNYLVRSNQDAIADLTLMIDSAYFIGTKSSSFSRFVKVMRSEGTTLL